MFTLRVKGGAPAGHSWPRRTMTPMMKRSIPMKGSTMVRCTRTTCERRSDHPRSCGTPSFLVIFPTIGPDTGVDDLRKAEPYDRIIHPHCMSFLPGNGTWDGPSAPTVIFTPPPPSTTPKPLDGSSRHERRSGDGDLMRCTHLLTSTAQHHAQHQQAVQLVRTTCEEAQHQRAPSGHTRCSWWSKELCLPFI